MYNDYEESFYYDKPSPISSGVSGEVVGLGLGLGINDVTAYFYGVSDFIWDIHLCSSIAACLCFYWIQYRCKYV